MSCIILVYPSSTPRLKSVKSIVAGLATKSVAIGILRDIDASTYSFLVNKNVVVFINNLFEGCVVLGVKVAVVVSCPESLEFGRDEHFLLQHLDALVQLVALVKVKVDLVDPFALALRRFALAFRTFFAHLFQQLNSLQLVLDW